MFRLNDVVRMAAVSVTFMLTACASSTALVESPSIKLANIRSGHLGFDRQTFVLEFQISNPNSFPLPVRAVRYNLLVAEQRFASGETAGEFTVPAGGDSAFAISVDLDMMQQTSRLSSFLRVGSQGDVPYKLDGSISVNIPMTGLIPFSNSGSIALTGSH